MHGFLTNVFVTAYDINHTINHLIQFQGNIFLYLYIFKSSDRLIIYCIIIFNFEYYWIS